MERRDEFEKTRIEHDQHLRAAQFDHEQRMPRPFSGSRVVAVIIVLVLLYWLLHR